MTKLAGHLYRVVHPNYVAGVIVTTKDPGRISATAPILSWWRGRQISDLRAWLLNFAGTVTRIE